MHPLQNLRRKPDYYRHDAPEWVRTIWPRPESFNWFVKAHRDTLMSQGAVVRLGRDQFVNVETFPRAAERILGVNAGEVGHG